MKEISINNNKCIFIGDFNINLLSNNSTINTSLNTFLSFGIVNTVKSPTHYTSHSSSLIDLCFTNCDNYYSGILDNSFSSHLPIFIKVNIRKFTRSRSGSLIVKRIYDKTSLDNFHCDLSLTDWNDVFDDLDPTTAYDKFISKFGYFYDLHFPFRNYTKRKCFKKPWMNNNILNKIRRKNKLFTHFLASKQPNDFALFKTFRNQLNKEIKSARKNYFQELFHNGDTKKTWKSINAMMGRGRNKPNDIALQYMDKLVDDPQKMCRNI